MKRTFVHLLATVLFVAIPPAFSAEGSPATSSALSCVEQPCLSASTSVDANSGVQPVLYRPDQHTLQVNDLLFRPDVDVVEAVPPVYRPHLDEIEIHDLSLAPDQSSVDSADSKAVRKTNTSFRTSNI